MLWTDWSGGIDWLTATAKELTPEATAIETTALQFIIRERRDGGEVKHAKRMQYDGIVCNTTFLGTSEDGLMLQVSGEAAHRFFIGAREELKDVRVTRLDTQRTCRSPETENRQVTAKIQELFFRWAGQEKKRSVAYSYTIGSRGDNTFAVGSRSSQGYCRAYHKSAQQQFAVADGLIRFEAELKGKRARQAWQLLCECDSVQNMSEMIVHGEFERKGVDLTWLPDAVQMRLPCERVKTSQEKRLNWFSQIVKSSVQKSVQEGSKRSVICALGLQTKSRTRRTNEQQPHKRRAGKPHSG